MQSKMLVHTEYCSCTEPIYEQHFEEERVRSSSHEPGVRRSGSSLREDGSNQTFGERYSVNILRKVLIASGVDTPPPGLLQGDQIPSASNYPAQTQTFSTCFRSI